MATLYYFGCGAFAAKAALCYKSENLTRRETMSKSQSVVEMGIDMSEPPEYGVFLYTLIQPLEMCLSQKEVKAIYERCAESFAVHIKEEALDEVIILNLIKLLAARKALAKGGAK